MFDSDVALPFETVAAAVVAFDWPRLVAVSVDQSYRRRRRGRRSVAVFAVDALNTDYSVVVVDIADTYLHAAAAVVVSCPWAPV